MFLPGYYLKKKQHNKRINCHQVLFASLLICATCSSAFTNHALKQSNALKDTVPVLYVGEGYLRYDGQGVGLSALDTKGLSIQYKKTQTTLNFSKTMKRSQLITDLNVGVSGSVGWGLFSASASANYVKNTKNDAYSENINYGESYTVDKLLDISSLTPTLKGLSPQAQTLYNTDPQRFASVYGDNFVQQLTEGVLLLVDVKLAFASSEDKQKFDAAVSAAYGSFGSLSSEVSTAESESHAKGSVEIYAYQLGGKPEELATVLAGKSKTGDYYVSTCSLTNFSSCESIIGGVIAYAAGPLKDQVKLTGEVSDNLAVIGEPTLKSYRTMFGLSFPDSLAKKVGQARKQLIKLYTQQNGDNILLSHLMAFPNLLNVNYIKTLLEKTQNNLQLFTHAMDCYTPGEETSCPTVVNNINKKINLKITAAIDKFKQAYLWGCSPEVVYPGASIDVYTGYPDIPYTSYVTGQTPISGNFIWSENNKKIELHGVVTGVADPQHIYGDWISQGNNIYRGYVGGGIKCPDYSYLTIVKNPL